MLPFRCRLTLDQRVREYENVRTKKPDYIPVIVERAGRDSPALDKEKFLVPNDLTASQFLYVLRRRLKMKSEQALFLLCNNRAVTGNTTLRHTRDTSIPSEDGFLYITYSLENAFG